MVLSPKVQEIVEIISGLTAEETRDFASAFAKKFGTPTYEKEFREVRKPQTQKPQFRPGYLQDLRREK